MEDSDASTRVKESLNNSKLDKQPSVARRSNLQQVGEGRGGRGGCWGLTH